MTLQQAISKYNLKEVFTTVFGDTFPPGERHFIGEKENAKSKTLYHVTNEFGDNAFFLIIESVSKTRFNKYGLPIISKSKIIEL